MGKYDSLIRKQAKKAVAQFSDGPRHTIVRKGTYNPKTSVEAADAPHLVRGLIYDFEQDEINGTTILDSDFKFFVAYLDLPTALKTAGPNAKTDRFTREGETTELRIVGVKPIRGGDLISAYELHVRG